MRDFEEFEMMAPSELYQVYNDLVTKSEAERLSREDKYKIEYLQTHLHEHADAFDTFYSM